MDGEQESVSSAPGLGDNLHPHVLRTPHCASHEALISLQMISHGSSPGISGPRGTRNTTFEAFPVLKRTVALSMHPHLRLLLYHRTFP